MYIIISYLLPPGSRVSITSKRYEQIMALPYGVDYLTYNAIIDWIVIDDDDIYVWSPSDGWYVQTETPNMYVTEEILMWPIIGNYTRPVVVGDGYVTHMYAHVNDRYTIDMNTFLILFDDRLVVEPIRYPYPYDGYEMMAISHPLGHYSFSPRKKYTRLYEEQEIFIPIHQRTIHHIYCHDCVD